MNPRITDLLDDYVDTFVQLFPPDQVLRGTGSGKKKSPNPQPAHHRMKKPLVAAAALLLVLTGIAAGYLTFSRGSSGTSLGDGMSEIPEISAVSPTPEPTQENVADSAESAVEAVPEDLVLDDTNSVIVTSGATGLSMRVPTEFQDGLKTDDNLVLTAEIGSPFEQSFNFNGIFTFYDTSNQDNYYGVVFTIDAWDQSDFDAYLSDPTIDYTFTLNSAVVGKTENSYYRMLQFGTPYLSVIPNFDNGNPDSIRNYYAHLQYAIPMVNSFIELNGLDPVETGLDNWADLFRQRMLEPMGIEVVTAQLSEPEETGKTFMENAFIKAEAACKETGLPAVADDSGLCVDYLDGAPGIYSARFAQPGKRRLTVLEKLQGVPAEQRGAHFVSAVCCVFPNGDKIEAEGKCFGTIAFDSRGENGFGYDSIFEQEGRTFGEMTDEEKDARSHRGKAFALFEEKLKEYLQKGE